MTPNTGFEALLQLRDPNRPLLEDAVRKLAPFLDEIHQALAFARKEWYFFLQEWRLMYGANYRK